MRALVVIGETVFLNSGSPPMTVTGRDGDLVEVEWRAADDKLQRDRFPTACLRKQPPQDV